MLKPGWLRRGLIDAQREADARPELRERVRAYPSGFIASTRFLADVERDTHRVFVIAGAQQAHEIVREVVNAIARNTGRNDKHACLHVAFRVRDLGVGLRAAEAAAQRIRDLYRGPYTRTFFTYDTEPQ